MKLSKNLNIFQNKAVENKNEGQKKNVTIDEDEDINDDYVVESMGAFGLYQFIFITLVSFSRFLGHWNTMAVIFITPDTKFSCVKFNTNYTEEVKNNTCYKSCVEYEYEKDVFDETMISEFGLICDKAWLASFTQTVMMFGLLCGVSLFGWISDRFGRSKALKLSGVTNIVFMFAAPFAPTYWIVTACRFFIGLGSGGIFALTCVYTTEVIGTSLIEVVSCSALLPDGIALACFAIFAYFTSSWRIFMLEYSVVSVLIVLLLFFLPETPRWLIANGKTKQAVKVMTRAAKMNKLCTEHITENVTKTIESLKLKETGAPTFTYLDLFRTKKLAVITIASVIIWFVTGLSYYGLNQYLSQIGSNLSVAVIILGFIQIPGSPIAIVVAKYFGRKFSTIGSFVSIGVSMIALIFIPEGTLASSVIGSFGGLAANVVFAVVYLFVIELYPTPIRNMGFSLSSAGSKLGAMVAPFVANLKPRWIASSIFALLPFLALFICLILPETKGKKLKDTVDEP